MSKIRLSDFDRDFLKTIKDYKKIHLDPDEGYFYTIRAEDCPVGVIGCKEIGGWHFLKIGIHQDFRGQGIFGRALNLLVKKHKLKIVYATIAISNIGSIKAHESLGFKKISPEKELDLRQRGMLIKSDARYVKVF